MSEITAVKGREILDSRGYPTVEVEVTLASGHTGRMLVPSGVSTGKWEAHELRDGDASRYGGRGVRKAVANVNGELAEAVIGLAADNQAFLDRRMIDLDATAQKSRLGANAILGISFAVARAAAAEAGKPFYRYLADAYRIEGDLRIPLPMVNVMSGGLHAGGKLDVQDYMVVPVGASSYPEALEQVSAVWQATRVVLNASGYEAFLVADEGGLGPALNSNEEGLEILCRSVEQAGLKPGSDIAIALDVASTHFYDPTSNEYVLGADGSRLTSEGMIDRLEKWVSSYPIVSIEDGLAEDDWEGWRRLTERLGERIQVLGDDLFTTNGERIQRGIDLNAANAVLVKSNQIGTLMETVEAIRLAKFAGFRTVISARSGETEDDVLADLAVGLRGGQIKIGSLTRSSRLSKYNRLLRIDEELGGAFEGGKVIGG
ncbi:MAG TPA: phosphopyruvate hydratase [Rhodothermales bacterium]|nr:phosphopyruvate hydratase [Rhodothermales bacterium]